MRKGRLKKYYMSGSGSGSYSSVSPSLSSL